MASWESPNDEAFMRCSSPSLDVSDPVLLERTLQIEMFNWLFFRACLFVSGAKPELDNNFKNFENVTSIIDGLLKDYDIRLRPNFGSKS